MSYVVSVAVNVTQGDSTHVNVCRVESVIPAKVGDPATIVQEDIDVLDLVRAALGRVGSEVLATADAQVCQLRDLLEGLAEA